LCALATAIIVSSRVGQRPDYGQYFVGSGDYYEDMRTSDRLQMLAMILGITGYWVYIAAVISVAVGLGIGAKILSSKCLPVTWVLTAGVSLFKIVSQTQTSGQS